MKVEVVESGEGLIDGCMYWEELEPFLNPQG
jgi:hypothetical protein